ncbi:MAG: AAA family ATPase [Candidatus Woesearchaeota archaeon]
MDNFNFGKEFVRSEVSSVLGQEEVKKQLKSAILMERHVVLVGPPGVGKTTLVKGIASILPKTSKGKERPFVRVQGSPDLTAEDLIGDIDPSLALKHGPLSKEAFTPGKIFKADGGILFFDEINRCSEKLQNSLLQALEEGIVTIGSFEVDFNANFILVGTMNPEEASTEPLSDVFLDRFDVIYMDAPKTLDIEKKVVLKSGKKLVDFPQGLLTGVVSFIRKLRANKNLEKHPSVRATIGVYERAQSNSYLDGKSVVEVLHVQEALVSVLSHRIRLKPSVRYVKNVKDFVREEFSEFYKDFMKESGGSP